MIIIDNLLTWCPSVTMKGVPMVVNVSCWSLASLSSSKSAADRLPAASQLSWRSSSTYSKHIRMQHVCACIYQCAYVEYTFVIIHEKMKIYIYIYIYRTHTHTYIYIHYIKCQQKDVIMTAITSLVTHSAWLFEIMLDEVVVKVLAAPTHFSTPNALCLTNTCLQ